MTAGEERYRLALADWLACAVGGRGEPAARAAEAALAGGGLVERVAFLGAAGHVLDFDDTYLPGLAHLSAPVAPAALALAADLGATVGNALHAYAAGFEAMGALARASHPGLYERGWHPTAVCGPVGAAVAAARLLDLDADRERAAVRLALLQAGGLRAAFGSDGKALQVGVAAAKGVLCARTAAGGATVSDAVAEGPAGFADVLGGRWAAPSREGDGPRAIDENWIKPWPCCLMAHSTVEAAAAAREAGGESIARARITVVVHPRARQAAAYDDATDGLQAKFSLPYLAAHALLRGEPEVASFAGVDADVRAFAADRVAVRTDESLGETEAVIESDGAEVARVVSSLGSPGRPLTADRLAAKVRSLAGGRLDGVLDDPDRPATQVLTAAGL